jgi:hypothetical protein
MSEKKSAFLSILSEVIAARLPVRPISRLQTLRIKLMAKGVHCSLSAFTPL